MMVSQNLMEKLLQLRLPAFREGLNEQAANPQYTELPFEDRLLLLVDRECSRRLDKRTIRRFKQAEFPMTARIEELDFSPERKLDRRLILELSQCSWIDRSLNVIIEGATGTGKSYLACALGSAACRSSYSVRYLHLARFLLSLTLARQNGTYLNLLRSFSRVDLLILDDWMRDPIQLSAAQDLLEIFDDRFGKLSTIIVSQVPVSDWHARFLDPTLADAILDRCVHNAYHLTLQGESQRKVRGFRTISHT
jgi:DNA replication protein DnaC